MSLRDRNNGIFYRFWSPFWFLLTPLLKYRKNPFGLSYPSEIVNSDKDFLTKRRLWWHSYVWNCARRTIGSGGGGVAVVSTVFLTAFIPIAIYIAQFSDQINLVTLILFIVVSFVLFGMLICYTTFISLSALPHEDFAEIALSARTESEILEILSFEAANACIYFTKSAAAIEDWFNDNVDDELESTSSSSSLDAAVAKLKSANIEDKTYKEYTNSLMHQEERIRRMMRLKEVASEELNIPHRRLCDQLLQYSPSIHRELLLNYTRNLRFMFRISNESVPNGQRFLRLRKENQRIYKRFNKRTKILARLFNSSSLHEHFHRIAAMHSTSGALVEYADALSRIAEKANGGLVEFDENTHRDLVMTKCKEISNSFEIVYRKQRAYPGMDVHGVLVNLLRSDPNRSSQSEVLEELGNSVNSKPNSKYVIDEIGSNLGDVMRKVDCFSKISTTVSKHIYDSRTAMSLHLRNLMEQEFESITSGKCLLVTHGFSNTIKSIVAESLSENDSEYIKSLSIFVLDTPAKDSNKDDTRKMVFELREAIRWQDNCQVSTDRVNRADANMLASLVNADDKLLVLLGTEAIVETTGSDNNKKRMVLSLPVQNSPLSPVENSPL